MKISNKTVISYMFGVIVGAIVAVISHFVNVPDHNVGDVYVSPEINIDNPFIEKFEVTTKFTVIDVKDQYCKYKTEHNECYNYRTIGKIRIDSTRCNIVIDTISDGCSMTHKTRPFLHIRSYSKIPIDNMAKIYYTIPLYNHVIRTDSNGVVIK